MFWLNHPEDIQKELHKMMIQNDEIIDQAQSWFHVINQSPARDVIGRIWLEIKSII